MDIFAAAADTPLGTRVQVTGNVAVPGSPSALYNVQPAWSPSGRYLAFASGDADPYSFQIFVYDAQSGLMQRLTTISSGYIYPVWSGDALLTFVNLSTGQFVTTTFSGITLPTPTPIASSTPSATPTPAAVTATSTYTPTPTMTSTPYPPLAANASGQWGAVYQRDGALYAYMQSYNGVGAFQIVRASDQAALGTGVSLKVRPAQPEYCEVTRILDPDAPLRLQPSLYEGNEFFTLQGDWPDVTARENPLPPRPWLWQEATRNNAVAVPDFAAFETLAIQNISYLPAIAWVSPSGWQQVEVHYAVNGVEAIEPLVGYVEREQSGSQDFIVSYGCNPSALATPTPDPDIPQVAFPSTTPSFDIPRVPLFSGNTSPVIPPAIMGNLGLHLGGSGTGPSNPASLGATIDIIPRNIELCIDSAGASLCDPAVPGQLIPVYSPVAGCATLTNGFGVGQFDTVMINYDQTARDAACQGINLVNERQIVITHVIWNRQIFTSLSDLRRYVVQAGSILGYLCTHATAQTDCNVRSNSPTHVAFQARIYNGTVAQRYIQRTDDVRPFLATPLCLYDDWESSNAPVIQLSPLHACPPVTSVP